MGEQVDSAVGKEKLKVLSWVEKSAMKKKRILLLEEAVIVLRTKISSLQESLILIIQRRTASQSRAGTSGIQRKPTEKTALLLVNNSSAKLATWSTLLRRTPAAYLMQD